MATLKEQVEGLTSLTIGTTPTTSEFETFLADGVKDVVDRILQFKPQLMPNFAKTSSLSSSSGLDIGGAQVLGVVRETSAGEYRVAEPINLNKRFIAKDSTSLEYRSKFNPGWYELDGKVFTIPDAGGSGSGASVTHISYASPTNSDTTISDFPSQYERYVALYAAIKVVDASLSATSVPDDLSIVEDVPVVVEAPSYAAIDASLQNAVDSFSKVLSGSAPKYNLNNTKIGITTLEDFLTFSSFTTDAPLIYDVEQPLPLPTASLSYDGPISTLVQYSDESINKLLTKVQALTPPAYTKQDFSLDPWTFYESPTFDDISVPDLPAEVGYVLDFAAAGPIPTPWEPGSDNATGTGSGSTQELDWAVFDTALGEDDYEKASAELTKISHLTTLRQDEFSKAMEVYKENVARINEKEANNKDKTWTMNLAKAGSALSLYQQKVSDRFTKWTHDFNRESTIYTQINTQKLSEATANAAEELNEYNRLKGIYDAEISAITKDIDNALQLATKNAELEDNLELQNAINAATKEVDQWQTELKRYELSMTKYAQDISTNLERYKADLGRELDTWKTRQVNLLSKFKDDITDATKVFDAENAVYQATIQRDLAELTSSAEASVQKMDLSTNVSLTNKAQELQGEIQKYNSKVDKYIAEVQTYEKKVATKVQEYTTTVSNKQMDYTWLKEQYDRLKAEYEANFAMLAPPQQAQAR